VGLSELIFIELVRRYLLTLDPDKAGWLSGLRDPVVHRALALMHEHPAYVWTLDALARQAAASRLILADRFTRLVGDPPMQYLARRRMQLAAGMLSEGTEKVVTIAQAVGYSSEAAFSRTYKRIAGSAPMVWRGQHGTSGAETAVGFIRDRCSSP
jgi:AraC-like DNA-binding protein